MLNYYFFLCIFPIFLFSAPPAWIDLPKDDYTAILNCHKKEAQELTQKIQEYAELPKEALGERISHLKTIQEFLLSWSDREEKTFLRSRLKELYAIASNKRWYLEQLVDSYLHGKFEDAYLETTLRSTHGLKKGRKALWMINERKYHTKYGEYWGEYWLEAMDPCHRQLLTYYDRWKKEKERFPEIPHFFLWLEEQNLSKDVPYLIYLSEEELKQATAVPKEGLLYLVGELASFEEKSDFLFIVDLDENLIIAPGSRLVHHNSLSHSKPILAAGKMGIYRGKVISLSFETGHYTPSVEDDLRMIDLLQELGVDLSHTIPLTYYDENGCQETTLGEFFEKFIPSQP